MIKIDFDEALFQIIQDEGGIKEAIYFDRLKTTPDFPKGVPTVGPGILLKPGYIVPYEVLCLWTNFLFKKTIEDYYQFEKVYNLKLDTVRRTVICGMIWNMGFKGMRKFKKMITALQKEDYKEAANQIVDSQVHRKLCEIRGKRKFEIRTEKWARLMKKGE